MKCYIASPFFNKEQTKEVENIKEILNKFNIDFFSPKDFFVLLADETNEKRKEIFLKNLNEIKDCDFMICNTNNKDMGSIFESGYAFSNSIPIIYFNQQIKGKFNVMLEQSGMCICINYNELILSIKKFIDIGIYNDNYKGDIE